MTIYALATPLGGAIAIIRISGDSTLEILQKIFTGKISHGRLSHGSLVKDGMAIDDIMAVYFRAPYSYTGEDMAELHIHSSRAVAKEAFLALSDLGAVPAQAGEFTKRAFLNGKIKLSEAEAVMDLISSTAKRSASSAMLQLSGVLSEKIRDIQSDIIDILSETDAMIDYPDEMQDADVTPDIEKVLQKTNELYRHGMKSRHIREGIHIAIVGRPNAGKSSLLNALISEDRAIVSDIAGTTRDIIEADTVFCDVPVHLYDTAGLHDTSDTVEKIGIERARAIMENADILYIVFDISRPITSGDMELLAETSNKKRIVILCKSDMARAEDYSRLEPYILVSPVTGDGIEELKRITANEICPSDETGIITNMRHIDALTSASEALHDALTATETDCMAQDLHRALHCLGSITGDTVDEDVLDRIFERFCVGK